MPLIASCIFHYELEFIHPFADGNGRMGRLWQTLILRQWRSLFAYLPVETIIKKHQDQYYQRRFNMKQKHRQKLIELGSKKLADALLDLAVHSGAAEDLIERLIVTPKENVQRFKTKLSELKDSDRYCDWQDADDFACELKMLLQGLKSGVSDPLKGIELVAEFYESDAVIFEMCDDSHGDIGDVFSSDAKELFVEYASLCTDKEKVADIILKVNKEDNYGIRTTLIDCAGECLSEPVIRTMIATLEKWADEEIEEYERRYYLVLIESLARQIKDAKLFEKTCIASKGEPSTATMIDTARVYLESGDIETAHAWLKKIPEDDTGQKYERDKLLLEIYQKQAILKN